MLARIIAVLCLFSLVTTSAYARRGLQAPQGKTTHFTATSKIFPGAVHDYWVYVPAQYDASKPACVMVFQDGGGSLGIANVMDSLIASGDMPVTIGIFINPGVLPAEKGQSPRYNRSFEYDMPSDQYARFLLEEILPEVGKSYNLSKDPGSRAIAGFSSGGCCAFTVAWERPDEFRRVLSFIGSFDSLHGDQTYPNLIRKREPKPIRIFLQDNSQDQDIYGGSWFLGNEEMAAALKFAGYDYTFSIGEGGHDGRPGNAIMPEALKWLWRGYPAPIRVPDTGSRQPVMDVLAAKEPWQAVAGIQAEAVTADATGNICYISGDSIYKLGDMQPIAKADGATVIRFGPNGHLYAARPKQHAIVDVTAGGKPLVRGISATDFVINSRGDIWASEAKTVWHVDSAGKKSAVRSDIGAAAAVALTPDQSMFLWSEPVTPRVWSTRIVQGGALDFPQPFFTIQLIEGATASGAGAMTTDTMGRLYVDTAIGIQVFDQAGRVIGIIDSPAPEALTGIAFGGPALDQLYAACGGKLYRRATKAHGVLPFLPPILPPGPQL